ncbi:MAG: glycoside hydrolase family 2 protein [Undibacterium sp.]|nr:glycoside hydrolase family 2 protein [Undibacterium sp.]
MQAKPILNADLNLSANWQFRLAPGDSYAQQHKTLTTWRSAQIPSHIHTDLLRHHLIPDPYQEMNEATLQWIGLAQWEYQKTFSLNAQQAKLSHHILVFEGLDTYADIYLNGKKLHSSDNAFREWRLSVEHKLKSTNVLRVVFHSPITRLLPQVSAMPHPLAGNYPSPYDDDPKGVMTGNFARKPSYHYGWDWGPRFVTAGIWKEVKLLSYSSHQINQLQVQQESLSPELAKLNAALELFSDKVQTVDIVLSVLDPQGKPQQIKQLQHTLQIGTQTATIPFALTQPQRWYPHGMGAAARYTIQVEVTSSTKATKATNTQGGIQKETQKRSTRIGLRTVELRRDIDPKGQGFEFVINGQKVFAKGANVIPFDMFPNRVTDKKIRQILQDAVDANMNMLRVWGGGYYEREAFYDFADELGLMIWQDFMFGGGVVPAYHAAFRDNVMQEAKEQVQRLSAHPSIVLWCGNNEEETAWKDWGIGANLRKANPEFADQVWQGYLQLFGHDLRQIVAQYSPQTPYWSSSPSNDLSERANDSERGDKHYWEVWAGSRPVEDYLHETPRFMSEYGLQSWPSQSTVDAFSGREQQSIDHPVITQHQKFLAGKGNERVLHYIRANYGEPKDFQDFIYLSQVMQAEGIALAASHHRASMPRTMGSLYWQLNDVWPGASWSSIDYFGRWKALHFYAKRFFAPITITALRDAGRTTVTVISDQTTPRQADVRMRVMDFEGKILQEKTSTIIVAANGATQFAEFTDQELLGLADPLRHFVVFELSLNSGQSYGTSDEKNARVIARQEVYFSSAKQLHLPSPETTLTWQKIPSGYQLSLHSNKLVRSVWLEFEGLSAHQFITLSDNAFTLLPGETKSLQIRGQVGLSTLKRKLNIRVLHGQIP